jgi:hypothetical protein
VGDGPFVTDQAVLNEASAEVPLAEINRIGSREPIADERSTDEQYGRTGPRVLFICS